MGPSLTMNSMQLPIILLCLQGAVNETKQSAVLILRARRVSRQPGSLAAVAWCWPVVGVGAALARCRHRQRGSHLHFFIHSQLVLCSASSVPQPVFTITEKAPTRAFSWSKAPTSAFTFKTLLRHYAKRALTPR